MVVGDVNYFFAPGIVLHRFFSGRSQAGLLIDEAHQLEGRVRDMHTAQITKGRFTAFRRDFGKEQGRKNDVYKSAGLIINILKEMPASGCLPLLPDGLFDALLSFADALDGHLWSRPNGGMQEYLLEIRDFLQIARLWDAHFGALCEPGGRLTITLRTPYALIAAKIAKTHGCVAFSGTLQPLASYAKILGGEDEDACLRLPSPYPTENQRTAIWPIDMRFAERGKRIPDIVALLRLIADKPGNYMVCFPSYAFLRAVFEACESMDIQAQQSGMDESQRGEFLAMFAEKPDRARIFFVVMGGVFAESVDLPGDRLSGAIILGLGLPQIGEFREAIMASYEEWLGDGFHYAYMLPGMSRVVQAAGRVIRSRTDRGFVILADSRFLNRRYAALLPDHWDIRICRDMPALRGILEPV